MHGSCDHAGAQCLENVELCGGCRSKEKWIHGTNFSKSDIHSFVLLTNGHNEARAKQQEIKKSYTTVKKKNTGNRNL